MMHVTQQTLTIGPSHQQVGGWRLVNDDGSETKLGYIKDGQEYSPLYLDEGLVIIKKFAHGRIAEEWLKLVCYNANPTRTGYTGDHPINPIWQRGGKDYESHMLGLLGHMFYAAQLYQELQWPLDVRNQDSPVVEVMRDLIAETLRDIETVLANPTRGKQPVLVGQPGVVAQSRLAAGPPVGQY